jgi:hypothetical protein
LIVLLGRGGGSIVRRRSSTNTSVTAISFGVTVIVVELPFVVLCNFAGKGLPTTFFALLASEGLTIFGDRFAGADFLTGAFFAATFLAGAFLTTFLTAFFAGAFLTVLLAALLATFLPTIFFGTDPPVC